MSQERWDIDLKILNGPMASLGTQVMRGPTVQIGSAPGARVFQIVGYRGVDHKHCVLTIYREGEAQVAAIGTNLVRTAPHAHVDWNTIDPIQGPVYLQSGDAIHLGAPGRGCTLQIVAFRRVGNWQRGQLGSVSKNVEAKHVAQHALGHQSPGRTAPATSRRLSPWVAPVGFLGCMSLMLVTTMTIVFGYIFFQPPTTLVLDDFPIEDQREYYVASEPERSQLVSERLDGFEGAYQRFIAEPNAAHARNVGGQTDLNHLLEPEQWDRTLLRYVVASFEDHARSPMALHRFKAIRKEYAFVLNQMRDAGFPDVFAAIPYRESRYRKFATSTKCALGWWQFMPEYGQRARLFYNIPDFNVRECVIHRRDLSKVVWTPTRSSVDFSIYTHRNEETGERSCLIKNPSGVGACKVDDRVDAQKSTQLFIHDFKNRWNDQELAASGAAIQIALLSHNAGWDAREVGRSTIKKTNLRAAYQRWKPKVGPRERQRFYGDNLTCKTRENQNNCQQKSDLLSTVQHYAYPIIAQHFLAVCFYGANYAEEDDIFAEYRREYIDQPSFCQQLHIKSKEQLSR